MLYLTDKEAIPFPNSEENVCINIEKCSFDFAKEKIDMKTLLNFEQIQSDMDMTNQFLLFKNEYSRMENLAIGDEIIKVRRIKDKYHFWHIRYFKLP